MECRTNEGLHDHQERAGQRRGQGLGPRDPGGTRSSSAGPRIRGRWPRWPSGSPRAEGGSRSTSSPERAGSGSFTLAVSSVEEAVAHLENLGVDGTRCDQRLMLQQTGHWPGFTRPPRAQGWEAVADTSVSWPEIRRTSFFGQPGPGANVKTVIVTDHDCNASLAEAIDPTMAR